MTLLKAVDVSGYQPRDLSAIIAQERPAHVIVKSNDVSALPSRSNGPNRHPIHSVFGRKYTGPIAGCSSQANRAHVIVGQFRGMVAASHWPGSVQRKIVTPLGFAVPRIIKCGPLKKMAPARKESPINFVGSRLVIAHAGWRVTGMQRVWSRETAGCQLPSYAVGIDKIASFPAARAKNTIAILQRAPSPQPAITRRINLGRKSFRQWLGSPLYARLTGIYSAWHRVHSSVSVPRLFQQRGGFVLGGSITRRHCRSLRMLGSAACGLTVGALLPPTLILPCWGVGNGASESD